LISEQCPAHLASGLVDVCPIYTYSGSTSFKIIYMNPSYIPVSLL